MDVAGETAVSLSPTKSLMAFAAACLFVVIGYVIFNVPDSELPENPVFGNSIFVHGVEALTSFNLSQIPSALLATPSNKTASDSEAKD